MNSKVIIVMPAYNAAATIEKTIQDIPDNFAQEIIVVDDASGDNTVEIALQLGLTVIKHDVNVGYGANQKTCYDEALKRGADIIIMIHADYQYDSRLAPIFKDLLETNLCDIMLGSRVRTRRECLKSGMPFYKYIANRLLSILENVVTGHNLSDWHTGYRAFRRNVLETIPYHRNSNDFVFDTQFLLQAIHFGFRIGDLPIPCRYSSDSSSIKFKQSIIYGLGTLLTLAKFVLQKFKLIKCEIFRPIN